MPSAPPRGFYAAFLVAALLRKAFAYVGVLYGFSVLGAGRWSGALYLCLLLPYLLSWYAGAVVDAASKRTVIRATSGLTLLVCLLLAGTEFLRAGPPGPLHLAAVTGLFAAFGILAAFAYPAYLAVVPDVVPRGDIGRVTAALNIAGTSSHVLGPLLVGGLRVWLDWTGVFACLAGLAALAWILLPALPARGSGNATVASGPRLELAGLRHHLRTQPALVAWFVALLLFSLLVAGPLEVLIPLFAERPLGLTPAAAGLFMAVGGAGMVLGAVAALRLVGRPRLGGWLAGSALGGTALIVAVTWSAAVPAFGLFFLGGACGGMFSALCLAGLQVGAPDAQRGRILGLYSLILGAVPAFGGLLAGEFADLVGTANALRLIFAGVFVLFSALHFGTRLWRAV